MGTTATIILIIINVAASMYAWKRPDIFQRWLFNPYAVSHHKQYYRFITAGFIHSNNMHLLFNMLTFYFFGSLIERSYAYLFDGLGVWFFLILYFAGMIIADLPTFLKHRNNPHYNSLGASGAVSAVVFSSIMLQPLSEILIFFVLPLPGFILGILYLLYSYYQGKRMSDNINHDAHLYGALFGIVFTIAIWPSVLPHFFEQLSNYSIF
jgi:membrane associated rhomboid family serine protease